jgi:hypothetical protein
MPDFHRWATEFVQANMREFSNTSTSTIRFRARLEVELQRVWDEAWVAALATPAPCLGCAPEVAGVPRHQDGCDEYQSAFDDPNIIAAEQSELPQPPSDRVVDAIAWLLSWTPARYDQHLRHEFGDETADEVIAWLGRQFGDAFRGVANEKVSEPVGSWRKRSVGDTLDSTKEVK